jgi:signal recognition particle subunit SRP54
MAQRILGMGDVLSFIEKAEKEVDEEDAKELERKLRKNEFTLEDFLDQLQQVKKMGPLQNVLGMMPGMPKDLKNVDIDDKEIAKVEAIIKSMTLQERRKPDIINGSRRGRIARGSGVTTSDVNALLKQFKQMQQMMKGMPGMRRKGKKGKAKRPSMPLSGFPGNLP